MTCSCWKPGIKRGSSSLLRCHHLPDHALSAPLPYDALPPCGKRVPPPFCPGAAFGTVRWKEPLAQYDICLGHRGMCACNRICWVYVLIECCFLPVCRWTLMTWKVTWARMGASASHTPAAAARPLCVQRVTSQRQPTASLCSARAAPSSSGCSTLWVAALPR